MKKVRTSLHRLGRAALILLGSMATARADSGFCDKRAIFAINPHHNHASCVVQTKNGNLLAAWYAGSGERQSDDVVIEGAWPPRDRRNGHPSS